MRENNNQNGKMNERKRDRNLVKDATGDPAFYNDQIDENKEPIKKTLYKRKG